MPSKASIRSMVSDLHRDMTDRKASSSYIPLQERDQWSDLTPVEQDDGPTPLVPIMYSEECKFSSRDLTNQIRSWCIDRDAMDHFRAVAASGEKSERGLELTETIIRLNPAHYTVWWAPFISPNGITDEKELSNADLTRAQAGSGSRAGTYEWIRSREPQIIPSLVSSPPPHSGS